MPLPPLPPIEPRAFQSPNILGEIVGAIGKGLANWAQKWLLGTMGVG